MLLLNLTSALGALAGIFHTASGCCAFFRLVAAFLKILLALPLMAIFAGIALTQRVINVVICRKVGSFDFYQYIVSSNLIIFVLGGPRKRRWKEQQRKSLKRHSVQSKDVQDVSIVEVLKPKIWDVLGDVLGRSSLSSLIKGEFERGRPPPYVGNLFEGENNSIMKVLIQLITCLLKILQFCLCPEGH